MENDPAEICQISAPYVSSNFNNKDGCRVHWTPVELEMGVIFLGSMRVNFTKPIDQLLQTVLKREKGNSKGMKICA